MKAMSVGDYKMDELELRHMFQDIHKTFNEIRDYQNDMNDRLAILKDRVGSFEVAMDESIRQLGCGKDENTVLILELMSNRVTDKVGMNDRVKRIEQWMERIELL